MLFVGGLLLLSCGFDLVGCMLVCAWVVGGVNFGFALS